MSCRINRAVATNFVREATSKTGALAIVRWLRNSGGARTAAAPGDSM